MLVLGALRLPADFQDLPGNLAADALWAGRPLSPDALSRLRDTRTHSVQRRATAERWFTIGYAELQSGNPDKSQSAYAQGLSLAPANGVAWAAYARALAQAGDPVGAGAARAHSVARAPHDPRAIRLRRD